MRSCPAILLLASAAAAWCVGCSPAPSTAPPKVAEQVRPAVAATPAVAPQPAPTADEALLMYQRFGVPNKDYNNQVENPRPLIPLRWLEYNAANVRFLYGYKDGWRLIGGADLATGQKIDANEAARRCEEWKRAESKPVPMPAAVKPPPPPPYEELDPGNIGADSIGTLPKTTERYHYLCFGAYDDENILIVPEEYEGSSARVVKGRVFETPAMFHPIAKARFFLKCDAKTVAKQVRAGTPIPMEGVYKVIGTKTMSNGETLPRLERMD
jgi:hypothetical protein